MKTKKRIIFALAILAGVAVVVSMCLLFLGRKIITDIPKSLSVEQVEEEFFLVAEYNNNHQYQFKIEQKIDGEYVLLANIKTETNSLNLSNQKFDIVAGGEYRFYACYATENGYGNGKFGEAFLWQPSWNLKQVKNVSYDRNEKTLSWDEVYEADSYIVNLIDKNGQLTSITSIENSLSLSSINDGEYDVYVSAKSNNDYIFSSVVSEKVTIEI